MENKNNLLYLGEGVLRSFFITLALIFILVIVSTFYDMDAGIRSACFVVLSMLSVVYGSIYSTRKIGKKGWLVGISVAFLYIIMIYFVAIIAGSREIPLDYKDAARMMLALLVGGLSGMLGINI